MLIVVFWRKQVSLHRPPFFLIFFCVIFFSYILFHDVNCCFLEKASFTPQTTIFSHLPTINQS